MPIARVQRDEALLEALVLKVRLLALEMIAEAWWPNATAPEVHACRRLDQLVEARLIEQIEVLAEPLLDLESPVFCWSPGEPEPNCEAVGYALQSRWTHAPRQTTVYVATKKAINQYGGRGRGGLRHRLQANHDLHVGVIFLHYLRTDPNAAAAWVGEDLLGKAGYGVKDPDAILFDAEGRPERVVEFGGRYDARRVRDFHEHCAHHGLRYELW